jgi:hypothetical protein
MAVRFTPGAVLRVPLAEGRSAYALMLADDPYIAFYRADGDLSVEDALQNAPVFTLIVVRGAYSRDGWGKVIHRVPADRLPPAPLMARQNRADPRLGFLVDPMGNARPVAPADLVGYEREAAWAAVHVESRLNDLYADRPNAAEIASRPVHPEELSAVRPVGTTADLVGAARIGPFDNDDAVDLVRDLADAPPASRIGMLRAVLTSAAGNQGYLQVDDGRQAVAAAAIVAAWSAGRTVANAPELSDLPPPAIPADLPAGARQALDRVVGPRSEWRSLWGPDAGDVLAVAAAIRSALPER